MIHLDEFSMTSAFGEEGLEALILAYKEASGYYWPKMKEHIIELVAAYPVSIAEFAMVSGDEEYVQKMCAIRKDCYYGSI